MRVMKPPEDLSEKEWTTQIVGTKSSPGLARQAGWWPYHTLRSKGSQPGYPDWTLLRERVVFLELKTEARSSKLSDAQRDVAARLLAAGAELYVVRPTDLEAITAALTARVRPDGTWTRPEGRAASFGLLERLRSELA